jgi:phosphocarrier protein FPr/phosphocarrier protein
MTRVLSTAVTLRAPLAGWVVPLADVPDPVFSGRILGDGLAIDPIESTLCAPCDGTVLTLHRAHHALTLRAANGAEILIHIGLDTVALGGEGFTPLVAEGQVVAVGDPLIRFDLDALARRVRSLLVLVVVTNGDAFPPGLPEVDRKVARGDVLLTLASTTTVAAPVLAIAADAAQAQRDVRMLDPHGMHARPAGLLADCAKRFDAEITLRANGLRANGRSAVSLLLLGVQKGDMITVAARGADAEAAVAAIAAQIDAAAGPAEVFAAAPSSVPVPAKPAASPLPLFAPDHRAVLTAVQAAPGVAVGHAVRLIREALSIPEAGTGIDAERVRLRDAVEQARAALRASIADADGKGRKSLEILGAHLSFLGDPDLLEAADALIAQNKSAAFAWTSVIDQRVEALRQLGNALLAERAADLQDIQRRVTLTLLGKSESGPRLLDQSILIADDLLPSQLTGLDPARLAGLCLAGGGPTSHVAILAASMGIPALVAAGAELLRVADGTMLILDADGARLQVNPTTEEIERVSSAARRRRQRSQENRRTAQAECRMADGTRIEVVANLGSPDDVPAALAGGAEGCGLLRSEFLFLDRDTAPSEDEQLAQYEAVATALEGRPLIIRTLDAGGDKDLPYAELPRDANPALGLRGVRIGLWRPELLRQQLRAILRVTPASQCRIMVPMIATLADLRSVRAMLSEEQTKLGLSPAIPLGIMIEVPSAAVMADKFAAEADFFSVGTNDLTQYTLAMDRTNPHLAKQLDAFHPAVLRLIGLAAEGARKHGRWVGVCGGLASFPLAAPVLIGLGVTELSATAAAVPEVKAMVRTLTMETCAQVARQALEQESAEAVRRLLAQQWPDA